jgi:hypothetical protein
MSQARQTVRLSNMDRFKVLHLFGAGLTIARDAPPVFEEKPWRQNFAHRFLAV